MNPDFNLKKFYTEIRMNGCYIRVDPGSLQEQPVSILITDFKTVDLTSEILDKGLADTSALKLKALILTSMTGHCDRSTYERFLKKGVEGHDLSDELGAVFSLIKNDYDNLVVNRKNTIRRMLINSISEALKIISSDEVKTIVDEVLISEVLTS